MAKRKQTVLIRKCAWCNSKMGVKHGYGVSGVTHGICDACMAKELSEAGLCVA